MTVLRNNLDVGPDGTTITASNSNDNGGDGFDVVSTPVTNGVIQYSSNVARSTAEYTMRVKTGTTSGAPVVLWSTAMGAQSQIWLRFYAYWPVLPNNPSNPIIFAASSGATGCAWMGINGTTGAFLLVNGPQTTNVQTAAPPAAGEWFRVECRLQFSTTTGNGELRYFADADSADVTEALSFSSWNLGAATANSFQFGYVNSDTNLEDMYLSGLALSTVDWIGPAPPRMGQGSPSGNLTNPVAIHTDCF